MATATMRVRVAAVALLAVAAAACGADPASGDARMLGYGYLPGTDVAYDLHQDVSMSMEAAGDAAGLLGMADTSMALITDQRLRYRFAEGPRPDTTAVEIEYELVDGSATITAAGQTEFVTFDDLAASMPLTPVELVVDASGEVVEVTVGEQAIPAAVLDAFGGSGDMLQEPHLGPVFPDHPVAPGEEWRVDLSRPGPGFEVRREGRFRVAGEETVAGRPVLRIEGTVTTDGFTMGLADVLEALAAAGEGGEPAGAAGIEALGALGIDIRYSVERSEMELVSWFDPVAGVVARAESRAPVAMRMEMAGVPEAGDVAVDLLMETSQTLVLVP
jgi:hypothetical protein